MKPLTPRLLRLELSTRYRCLQKRAESSVSGPHTPRRHAKPNFFRRNRSTLAWTTLSLALGGVAGQVLVHTFAPPELPQRGTREDSILMADLNQRIDNEFKVKVLRGKCLGVSKQLKGEEGGWIEIMPLPLQSDRSTEVEDSLLEHMQGARGLGVERLFWDRGDKQLVAVIWFGGALCGWPGVTHGGAIATAMAEKLSLAAALADHADTDVLAAATPQRLPGTGNHAKMMAPTTTPDEPAQLSIGYVKPTYANSFYVVRVKPALQNFDIDSTSEPLCGAEYEATLETLDAQVCVKARAKFAPSSAPQRLEKKAVRGVEETYGNFKEWMWPSRQQTSQSA